MKLIKSSLLILLFLILNSCSSDGSVTNFYSDNQFLGKWSYTSVAIDGVENNYVHKENCDKDYVNFLNNEGQYHQFNEIIHFDQECHISQTILDWKISGKKLILTFGNQKLIYFIEELTADNLQFSGNIDIDNDGNKEFIQYKFTKYILN